MLKMSKKLSHILFRKPKLVSEMYAKIKIKENKNEY